MGSLDLSQCIHNWRRPRWRMMTNGSDHKKSKTRFGSDPLVSLAVTGESLPSPSSCCRRVFIVPSTESTAAEAVYSLHPRTLFTIYTVYSDLWTPSQNYGRYLFSSLLQIHLDRSLQRRACPIFFFSFLFSKHEISSSISQWFHCKKIVEAKPYHLYSLKGDAVGFWGGFYLLY